MNGEDLPEEEEGRTISLEMAVFTPGCFAPVNSLQFLRAFGCRISLLPKRREHRVKKGLSTKCLHMYLEDFGGGEIKSRWIGKANGFEGKWVWRINFCSYCSPVPGGLFASVDDTCLRREETHVADDETSFQFESLPISGSPS